MIEQDLSDEIMQYCCAPITRRITSMKNLLPSQRRRLKQLKEIFRDEGRIPLGTSIQERRYLFRLEAGRRRYRKIGRFRFYNWKGQEEAKKSADPSCDRTIEEILASMARRKDEQSEGSKE